MERGTADAVGSLADSAGPLDTLIPGDAFGSMGAPLAAAGNSVGAGLGVALTKLADLSRAISEGAGATRTEFERIDGNAAAAFRAVTLEHDR